MSFYLAAASQMRIKPGFHNHALNACNARESQYYKINIYKKQRRRSALEFREMLKRSILSASKEQETRNKPIVIG